MKTRPSEESAQEEQKAESVRHPDMMKSDSPFVLFKEGAPSAAGQKWMNKTCYEYKQVWLVGRTRRLTHADHPLVMSKPARRTFVRRARTPLPKFKYLDDPARYGRDYAHRRHPFGGDFCVVSIDHVASVAHLGREAMDAARRIPSGLYVAYVAMVSCARYWNGSCTDILY